MTNKQEQRDEQDREQRDERGQKDFVEPAGELRAGDRAALRDAERENAEREPRDRQMSMDDLGGRTLDFAAEPSS